MGFRRSLGKPWQRVDPNKTQEASWSASGASMLPLHARRERTTGMNAMDLEELMNRLPTSTRDRDRDSATSSHTSWLTRLLSCSAFIAIGVVLSVLVAWACALWSHIPEQIDSLSYVRSRHHPEILEAQRQLWVQDRPVHFPNQPEVITPYELGFGIRKTELTAYRGILTVEELETIPDNEFELRSYEQRIITAGWPLPSMQMSIWDEIIQKDEWTTEANFITGGFAIGGSLDELHMLPLRPVAWGMLVSAIFWGGLAFLGFRRIMCLRRTIDGTCLAQEQSDV